MKDLRKCQISPLVSLKPKENQI